jgi:hypothetical protein
MATKKTKETTMPKKTTAAQTATEWWVEIVPIKKGGEVRRAGPYSSERLAERGERGAMINLDHERFFVRIVTAEAKSA